MTTLVTGATGFLGRHLVDRLVAQGMEVRALVRPETDATPLRDLGVEVVHGDLGAGDLPRATVEGCELVYHLAGIVSHRRHDRAVLNEVNVGGTRRLLAAVDPGTRVVHVSSVATLGPVVSPQERGDEEHDAFAQVAQLPYAAAKRAAERIALAAAADGAEVVVANPGFLLGPGDLNRVSTWPVSAYLAGRLRFTTNGGLSFVDVRDVARGLVTLPERGRAGERTILTSEAGNLSWREFFALLGEVSGVHRRMAQLPRRTAIAAAHLAPWLVAPDEVRAAAHWWFFSPAKAERELDFSTRPLARTLFDTVADHERPRA